jgi:acetyl/propionyl-CoA carboxylase alpha subunit
VHPRHIEIQIMADSHDILCSCSNANAVFSVVIVVEEAPFISFNLSTKENGEVAVLVAKNLDYHWCRNGRVLLDENNNFIF